jgi:hypothetical protein
MIHHWLLSHTHTQTHFPLYYHRLYHLTVNMNITTSFFRFLMMSSYLLLMSSTATASVSNSLSLLRSKSSYRDQYQRHLQQIQSIQQYHQQVVRDVINALPLSLQHDINIKDHTTGSTDNDIRLRRQLQNATSAPTTMPLESLCNSDGSVDFVDDDFNLNAFDAPSNIFKTMCTCTEGMYSHLLGIFREDLSRCYWFFSITPSQRTVLIRSYVLYLSIHLSLKLYTLSRFLVQNQIKKNFLSG